MLRWSELLKFYSCSSLNEEKVKGASEKGKDRLLLLLCLCTQYGCNDSEQLALSYLIQSQYTWAVHSQKSTDTAKETKSLFIVFQKTSCLLGNKGQF